MTANKDGRWRNLLEGRSSYFKPRDMGVLFALIGVCLFFTVMSDKFLTVSNFLTVARQVSLCAIVGVGLTFIMITGNIDLAVGSYLAFSGIFVAKFLSYGMPWFVALIAIMVVMGVINMIVGMIVAKQKLSALIITLAMMMIAKGIALSYSNGAPIFIKDETFIALGTGYIGRIPIPVVIMFVVLVIAQFVLKKTLFGRYVYAVGGNEIAAISSGINAARIKIAAYVIGGMLTALAGCILAGRLFSGNPNAGVGFEMDVISAVVIGGTSLFGGAGGMWGTLIGSFTVGVIGNGLTILGVSYYYQLIAKGLIIYIAIYIDKKTREMGKK
jgi:ribose transport system permease protein